MSESAEIMKILYIDNDISSRDLFEKSLAHCFDITFVLNLTEGKESLTGYPEDAVVIRHDLPGTDGIGILKDLKDKFPSIPFIILTHRGSVESAREAFLSGASDYISGNFDNQGLADKLLKSVKEVVEKAGYKGLHCNEEKFKAIFNYSGMGIGLIDLTGRFVDANPTLQKMLGYSNDELLKMRISEITYPDDFKKDRENMNDALRSCETLVQEVEKRYIRKDGQVLWGRRISTLIRDQDGNPMFGLGMVEDITERKRTQDEYNRLFDLSLDPLCVAGFDGYFKKINPVWSKILGWSREEMLSKPWLDFVHPEDYNKTIEVGKYLVSGESVFGFENRYRCKDGTYRWLSWNSFPVPEERLIFAVARDVTDKKETEEEREQIKRELLAERNLLEKIMHSSPVGITIVDKSGRITFANAGVQDVLGLTVDEIMARTYNTPEWKMTDFDGNPFPEENLPYNVVMSTHKPVTDLRHAVETPDGKRIYLSINASPLFDDNEELSGMVAIVNDITEEVLSRRKLHLSEEKYRTIFEITGTAIVTIEEDMTMSLVNRKFEEITGYKTDEIVGKLKWTALVHKDFIDMMNRYHNQRRIDPDSVPQSYEFQLIDKNGVKKDILINIAMIPGTKKSIASFQDISSLKQMEEDLVNKNRELNDFAYMVSHDLRNPINLVIGFLTAIQDDPSIFDEYFGRVIEISTEMMNFIEKLLKLSRAGTVTDKMEKIEIAPLIRNIYTESIMPGIPSRLEIECPNITIIADKARISQVFSNLLNNCFKHRDPEQEFLIIKVSCCLENSLIKISVKDNGSGIESNDMERIFRPGYTKGKGTGFGLAIVRKIIEAHKGSIEVKSEGRNRGVEFIINFPGN